VSTLDGKTVLLDCRWLGFGGAGRATELLLRDLGREPPPGRWLLWGDPARTKPFAFGSAEVVTERCDPRALFGQRAALRVPAADVAVYTHQIRPLRPGRSVTLVHDTIPLRHGGSRAARAAKRAYFLAVARLTTEIVTVSERSKQAIVRDLAVDPGRIRVARYPIDRERAAKVAELRARLPQEPVLLYVGRFAPHKNLERLVEAFSRTRFAAEGGRLVLVGDTWPALSAQGVEVRGECSEDELDRLMASSRALVLPSLEEGYGLPAFEAAASGLPVAVSGAGATADLPSDRAVFFRPDVEAMAAALDEATSRPPRGADLVVDGDLRDVFVAAAAAALEAHPRKVARNAARA
jgi:glycosyltransferase involved in cell wall biosynthesis